MGRLATRLTQDKSWIKNPLGFLIIFGQNDVALIFIFNLG